MPRFARSEREDFLEHCAQQEHKGKNAQRHQQRRQDLPQEVAVQGFQDRGGQCGNLRRVTQRKELSRRKQARYFAVDCW